MKASIPTFHILLQNFFLQRLTQQNVSTETIHSYRDTFRIYLEYLTNVHDIEPAVAELDHFDCEYIQGFCKYLKEVRGNKAVKINNRLAGIRSFMQYVVRREPEYGGLVKDVLMVPFLKHETPTIDFITKSEFEAMTDTCDTSTFIGARDKLMLLLLYNAGLRVSELVSLSPSDVKYSDIPNRTCIKIYGKGRKERIVPLWKATSIYLRDFLTSKYLINNDALFYNKNGERLTRSGIRFRIDKIVNEAIKVAPTLAEKNITPHTFRHSVAMNLLSAGVDISTIAIWLGHSSIETTHKYMVADIELKRKAMEKAGVAGNTSFKYTPSDDILRFLNML